MLPALSPYLNALDQTGLTPGRWLVNHKLCVLKDEEDAFLSKYKKLNEAVVGVIEDYSLVSFIPLHVEVRCRLWHVSLLVHGQVTIIFVVSVCLSVCLFVQSFSQPSLIRFRSN